MIPPYPAAGYAFFSFVLTKEKKAAKKRKTSFGCSGQPGLPHCYGGSAAAAMVDTHGPIHIRAWRRRGTGLTSGSKYSPSGARFAPPFPIGRQPDGGPALSLRLTRLAAHRGTCQSPCSYAGPRCYGSNRVVTFSVASVPLRAVPGVLHIGVRKPLCGRFKGESRGGKRESPPLVSFPLLLPFLLLEIQKEKSKSPSAYKAANLIPPAGARR